MSKKTIIVGTVRGNKWEFPKLDKQKDNIKQFSSKLCVAYSVIKKQNKKVFLLSSIHNPIKIGK